MKFIFCFLIAACCSILSGCNFVSAAGEDFQKNLLHLHNENRLNHGLNFLKLNPDLCVYAQKHAEKMAKNQRMYHSNLNQVEKINPQKNWNSIGENVAWGQESENIVVNDWMQSPGHRWNILTSSFKEVGFGLAKDSKGRNYWCAVFSS